MTKCAICISHLPAGRHQCRACGKICCDACTKRKARLPNFAPKPMQRCCLPCVNDIANGRAYGVDEAFDKEQKYKPRAT